MHFIVNKSIRMLLFISTFLCADTASDFNRNIQLDEQKKIFEQFEKQIQNPPTRYEVNTPELQPTPLVNEHCIVFKEITYENITLLSMSDIDTIIKRYLDQCITEASLKNLLNELSSLYLDKGYITSRVYLKEQDASQGQVHLIALEGKIEAIQTPSSDITRSFESQTGEYLNLRELESALTIVNRLPSNNVTMHLIPSETNLGESIIALDNNRSKPFSLELGDNNYGNTKTGRNQISAKVTYDNLLDLSDQIALNLNTTDHHFQNENSVGNSVSYAVPIGTIIYTLSYIDSDYKQLVPSGANKYKMDGHTKTYELSALKELFHNQAHTFNVGASVSSYEVESYISDSLIDTSTYRLSKSSLSLDYSYRSPQLFSYALVKYIQGTDWFGSHNPTDLDEKYSAFQLDISLMVPVDVLRYKLNFHGQYSDDQLFNVNQLSIGGAYSIRGYQDDGLSGNSGFYLRNELSYPSFAKELLSWVDLAPYLALDSGAIHKEEDSDGGRLMSYSLGIQLNKYAFSADLSYSVPLWKEDVQNVKPFLGFFITYKY